MLKVPNFDEKGVDFFELGLRLLETSSLPEELKETWAERLEGAENPEEIYKKIQDVINKRNKLNSGEGSSKKEKIAILNEKVEKEAQDIVKTVENTLNNRSESIGRGATAEVYVKKLENGHSQYCFKFIYNLQSPDYLKYNNIKEETGFLLKLYNLNLKGVKIPEPIGYIETDLAHVLIMEKLNAITLASVLEEGEKLPTSFNAEDFFKRLEEFVLEMHKNRIHHRDLHSGNIMIDIETGEPCMIDFGRSKEFIIEPQEPETYYLEFNGSQGNRFVDDLAKIKEYKQAMLKHLNK